MRFDIDNDHDRLLILLILTDIIFIIIHILHKFTVLLPDLLFNIEFDGGYAEYFQYTKEFWIILLLFCLSIKKIKASLFFLVFTFFLFTIGRRFSDS